MSEVDVAIFLARCRAKPAELDRLMRLARLTDAGYRLQQHGEKVPDELRSLIVLETNAEAIAGYEPSIIPGLLQTESYIRESFRWGAFPEGPAFELRVHARLARQAILNRHWPPRMTFFIHEHALRGVVGDSAVMYEQILHLVLATSWPRCEIRVVLASAAPVAAFGCGFYLIHDSARYSVAYAQLQTVSLFLDDAADLSAYQRILRGLASASLDRGESRECLASLASEHDRVEAHRDDRAEPPRIGLA